MIADELKNNFTLLDDDEKLAYLIELGKSLAPYPQDKKDDGHKVEGCSSSVWLYIKRGEKLQFFFDSDAIIVRGLLYILKVLFDNKSVKEIKKIDAVKFLNDIGLATLLSYQRQVGISAIIAKIQDIK